MSRSGYSDDLGGEWAMICWRGAVKAALRGARGQAFLRELVAALDALEKKELVAESLATPEGEFCALGAVGKARGLDMSALDPENYDAVAATFGIAGAMAREIVWLNDEGVYSATPAGRWRAMRTWATRQLKDGVQ